MNHVIVVKVVDGLEDLLDRLGSVFLCKLAVFADPVKELSPSRQLGDYIIFVLRNIKNQYRDFQESSPTEIPLTRTSHGIERCLDVSFFAAEPSHRTPSSRSL